MKLEQRFGAAETVHLETYEDGVWTRLTSYPRVSARQVLVLGPGWGAPVTKQRWRLDAAEGLEWHVHEVPYAFLRSLMLC